MAANVRHQRKEPSVDIVDSVKDSPPPAPIKSGGHGKSNQAKRDGSNGTRQSSGPVNGTASDALQRSSSNGSSGSFVTSTTEPDSSDASNTTAETVPAETSDAPTTGPPGKQRRLSSEARLRHSRSFDAVSALIFYNEQAMLLQHLAAIPGLREAMEWMNQTLTTLSSYEHTSRVRYSSYVCVSECMRLCPLLQ